MILAPLVLLLLGQLSTTLGGPSPATIGGAPDFFSFSAITPSLSEQCTGAVIASLQGDAITCTRASTAYCTKSDGTMVSVASDRCRVTDKGIFSEGGRTNYKLQAEDFTTGYLTTGVTVSANTHAAPWGGTTMDTITYNTGNVLYEILSRSGASQVYTASAFARAISSTRQAYLDMYFAGPIPSACSCRTNSGAACTLIVAATDCAFWSEFTTTVDRLAITANVVSSTVYAAVSTGNVGILSGGTVWSGIQVEEATFASSYIPTVGTAVARASDNIHTTPAQAISTTGCVGGTVTFGPVAPANGRILGGAVATGVYVVDDDTVRVGDGTNTVSVDPGGNLAGQTMSFKASWGAGVLTLIVNGVTATGSFDGNMDMGTVYFGSQAGSSNFLYGSLLGVKFNTNPVGCL